VAPDQKKSWKKIVRGQLRGELSISREGGGTESERAGLKSQQQRKNIQASTQRKSLYSYMGRGKVLLEKRNYCVKSQKMAQTFPSVEKLGGGGQLTQGKSDKRKSQLRRIIKVKHSGGGEKDRPIRAKKKKLNN